MTKIMPFQQRIGVYPGTFDPITTGHLDIVLRAAKIVDYLIVGVAKNAEKKPLFSLEERVSLVSHEINDLEIQDRVEVKSFDTLLVQFAAANNASVIIKGLRVISDFEYEFQMAAMNAKLNNAIETAFLMTSDGKHFIASSFVKEISRLNGDISQFVSHRVADAIKRRLAEKAAIKTRL